MNKVCYVLVIGDEPDKELECFSKELEVAPYLKYEYKSRSKIKKLKLEIYKTLLENIPKEQKPTILKYIRTIEEMSDDEYYKLISVDGYLDENNNCISTINPNSKFEEVRLVNLLKNKNGEYVNSLKLCEWDNEINIALKERLLKIYNTIKLNIDSGDDDINIICDSYNKNDPTYFNKIETFEDFINIHRIGFDSVIYKNKWYDFNINTIEDKLLFYKIINEINNQTKITTFIYE